MEKLKFNIEQDRNSDVIALDIQGNPKEVAEMILNVIMQNKEIATVIESAYKSFIFNGGIETVGIKSNNKLKN